MARPNTVVCLTQQMIDQLPADAGATVTRALAAPHVKTQRLVAVLAEHGLEARAENVNRHRRRLQGGNYACTCPLPTEAPS